MSGWDDPFGRIRELEIGLLEEEERANLNASLVHELRARMTLPAVGLLLEQLALDREQPYWQARSDDLDAAEAWLCSLRDHYESVARALAEVTP